MAAETEEKATRLVLKYQEIRRREYEMITDLLAVLPKIETLDEERVAQVRDALFHADHPFLMVFIGTFSSGKSSLINALLGKENLLRVGATPTTDRISILRYGDEPQRMDSGGEVDTVFYPSPLLKKVSFVDTPGLESIFKKHEQTTRKFLHRSDVVLLVMLATQAMTQTNLENIQQLREYGKKVIIVLNQADLLEEDERETVRQYVLDQSRDRLGFEPEVWLVSAKQGMMARRAEAGKAVTPEPSDRIPFETVDPEPMIQAATEAVLSDTPTPVEPEELAAIQPEELAEDEAVVQTPALETSTALEPDVSTSLVEDSVDMPDAATTEEAHAATDEVVDASADVEELEEPAEEADIGDAIAGDDTSDSIAQDHDVIDVEVIEDDEDDTTPPAVMNMAASSGPQVTGPVDWADLWRKSGMYLFEEYIETQLDDVDRLRQKLQTPLQITQSVHRVALDAVKANQAVLDQYQGIADNVHQQLDAYRKEQENIVRDYEEQIGAKFSTAADRGSEAIRETFQLSRAVGSVGRGFTDLIGISRLFRRRDRASYARVAFEKHKVYEPLDDISELANRVGPRLEGKDLQDIDDLVRYAQAEIDGLPGQIQDKVIGKIQPPLKYDRTPLGETRQQLEAIERQAREDETQNLDASLKSAFFSLAVWELLIVVIAIVVGIAGSLEPVVILILLVAALLGLLMTPLIGRVLSARYANHLLTHKQAYLDVLSKSANKQVDYGMRLRRDVVSPLTRLVETQTTIQTDQMNTLQRISQEIVEIETDLTKLGKRRFLGLGV